MGISPGAKAWIGLTAYVLAYDTFAIITKRDTMSTAFAEAMKHPTKRAIPVTSWWYITVHLHGWMGQYDPLSNLAALPERLSMEPVSGE